MDYDCGGGKHWFCICRYCLPDYRVKNRPVKILVVGTLGIGKSTILNRMIEGSNSASYCKEGGHEMQLRTTNPYTDYYNCSYCG